MGALMAAEVLVRPAREERLRAALWFAERGFGVFSVWSANDDGVCRCPKGVACESPGKHPVPGIGFKAATTDPELIRRMLEIPSDPNWGMLPPDGVFALDVDGAGVQELAKLEARYGALPATLRTATAHGQHIFLRWPDAHPRPIGQLFGFVTRWGSGRDAGYVIGPRSVHATGAVYAPVAGSLEIAEMPEAWARAAIGTPAEASVTFSAGYQLPDRFPAGTARYKEVLRYTAHLYDTSRLSRAEMWPLVRDVLAPRFAEPLTESELRERFDRVTKDMGKRLGDRRNVPDEKQAPVELEDAPLTEFDSEPVQWLWGSWLPRGVVTLMDGNPGVSKSTLVADLVARVTRGREWPDGTSGKGSPARAMWITTEDDPGRVLRPRIEAAGGDASLVRFVKGEVVFPSGKEAFTELVVKRARERAGLALVILDPLFSHIDATVRTIADAEMRKGVMNPLTAAAEAADVAILVVRHFSKDTTASAVNRGAGSLGGIVGAARALWTVIADPEDETGETKVVGVSKLNYARAHRALRYRVVDRVPPGWLAGSVSGIEWLGEASTSIETMLSAGPRSGEAARTLEEILAAGPVARGGREPDAVTGLRRRRDEGREGGSASSHARRR
jgi:hypothetical protein